MGGGEGGGGEEEGRARGGEEGVGVREQHLLSWHSPCRFHGLFRLPQEETFDDGEPVQVWENLACCAVCLCTVTVQCAQCIVTVTMQCVQFTVTVQCVHYTAVSLFHIVI